MGSGPRKWDETAPVTPLGQLAFFIDYLKQAGLFDAWVADCPLALDARGGSFCCVANWAANWHRTNPAQPLLGFAEVGPDQAVWEYAAPVTSLDNEILTLGQLYRDRADCRPLLATTAFSRGFTQQQRQPRGVDFNRVAGAVVHAASPRDGRSRS